MTWIQTYRVSTRCPETHTTITHLRPSRNEAARTVERARIIWLADQGGRVRRENLTDAEWARIRPLLPPPQPPVGCRRHDHRTVLSGILWVLRHAAPWREMPARFGKWNTPYVRYHLWRAQGLWQRIVDALCPEGEPPS